MVQANTVLAPFNLSPRRELPSHVKAHERQELMDKEKEEEASRCVHKLNLQLYTIYSGPSHPPHTRINCSTQVANDAPTVRYIYIIACVLMKR